ncbi:MAG TPA: metalloregulator ArsR/SmtB family transcription factor [Acidimicrobiales bacterium]|nr:metalloregulator ArsR/SmtB family transcription factor [Acidimicrobiales bacterium]
MSTNVDQAIAALGDPTRRAIFELVARGPVSVGVIAQQVPVSRPAVSQHLKVLKEAELVIARADGTRRLYEMNPAGMEALRSYFERFWNTALWAFKRAAEQAANEEDR